MHNSTRTILERHSTSLHLRDELPALLLAEADNGIDVCFIDGSHSCACLRLVSLLVHVSLPSSAPAADPARIGPSPIITDSGVLADFVQLAPHCTHFMFHDIVDRDVSMLQARTHRYRSMSGGVPAFWQDVKAEISSTGGTSTSRHRVLEFIQQPAGLAHPVFGIGLLLLRAPLDRQTRSGRAESRLLAELVARRAESRLRVSSVSAPKVRKSSPTAVTRGSSRVRTAHHDH